MPDNIPDYYRLNHWFSRSTIRIDKGITIPFIPELAAQIGANDALLLTQIDIWLRTLDDRVEEIGGLRWLQLSAQEMIDLGFEHVTRQNINRTIERLVKRGLVQVRYRPGSCTKWLTLNYEQVEALGVKLPPIRS
jgi:hypothetical protein